MAARRRSSGPQPGLSHLEVRNFAIIDDQSLKFGAGMTVLTGETGAGKSLLVDALNIVVGERASADLVQHGARAAEVNASFEPGPDAHDWLCSQALDDEDGLCTLRRIIGADGRSRAFINGRPVPVSQLRELGSRLLDVHGQHAHQSLLQSAVQRQLLDDYGNHQEILNSLGGIHQQIRNLDAEIQQLQAPLQDQGPRADYLRYQLDELRGQALEPVEFASLSADHRRLSHGAELILALAELLEGLDEHPHSANARIAAALTQIESLRRLDPDLSESAQVLSQAQAVLSEAVAGLRHYAEHLQPDTSRLGELEQRLSSLEDLARKHHCRAEELMDKLRTLEDELRAAETSGQQLAEALAQRAQLTLQYQETAARLSRQRETAGQGLQKAVNRQLQRLGLENAHLEICLSPLAEDQLSAHGAERVELQISTNPGQPPRSLSRVASGGELSRIGLALQAVAVGDSGVPTIVFDEVDAGIGGRTAEIVGRLMRDLGHNRQVLTVTHLPQVASLAHHQIRVTKLNEQDTSRTLLRELDPSQRVAEIARMLAGVEVTAKSRAHAREMLATALGDRDTRKKSSA